jgi:hypothetical protein
METFVNSSNEHISLYDYPFYKKVGKDGALMEFSNSDALAQAVKIWLASKRNEKIRSRGGGILYQYLGKLMDDKQKDAIQYAITQGLQYDFTPPLVPVLVTVDANYDKERWEIGIVAYNADLAVGVNTKVTVLNANV